MTTSGDAAVAAAAERAATTREVNLGSLPPLPVGVPTDTANVRLGPEIAPAMLAVLPLVGAWRGEGRFGNEPGERAPQFGQQITFAHDGRAFLRYESVTWLLAPTGDASGAIAGPGAREIGWLRGVPAAGEGDAPGDRFEFTVVHADGRLDLFTGTAPAVTRWEFAGTTGSRLYGITPDGRLAYVDERISGDDSAEPEPYASALLERIAG